MKRYTLNETFFDAIDTEEKAYFLGLLGSDGWIDKRGRIGLGLSGEEDVYLLKRLATVIGFSGPIYSSQPAYPGSKRHYKISITNAHMSAALVRHGIVNQKSLIYEFPTGLRPDLVRHYVRGYVDGDGSVSIKQSGDVLVGVTSSRRFVKALAVCIHDHLGLQPHVERFVPPRNQESGNLKIGGNLVVFQFLDWIYRDATIFMARKEAKYRTCRQLVVDRLSRPERLYNLLRNPKVMKSVRRCATLLDIELDVDGSRGLSISQIEQDDILRMYAQGYGIQHIRTMRQCSNTLIRNVLKRNEVKIRNVTEQSVAQKRLLIAA